MATIEDPDYTFPGDVSGEMGSLDELARLNITTDGVLDTVSNLRRSLGADHCTMVLKQTDGSAGVAYRPGVSMICFPNLYDLSQAHFCPRIWTQPRVQPCLGRYRILHQSTQLWMASRPARIRAGEDYHGLRFGAGGSGARIQHFSNPDVQYLGANTGAVNGYDATGDATADPRAVSGGLDGNSGSGYDGTNSSLGARNGPYILANAPNMADNSTRSVPVSGPEISIEYPPGTNLTDGLFIDQFRSHLCRPRYRENVLNHQRRRRRVVRGDRNVRRRQPG